MNQKTIKEEWLGCHSKNFHYALTLLLTYVFWQRWYFRSLSYPSRFLNGLFDCQHRFLPVLVANLDCQSCPSSQVCRFCHDDSHGLSCVFNFSFDKNWFVDIVFDATVFAGDIAVVEKRDDSWNRLNRKKQDWLRQLSRSANGIELGRKTKSSRPRKTFCQNESPKKCKSRYHQKPQNGSIIYKIQKFFNFLKMATSKNREPWKNYCSSQNGFYFTFMVYYILNNHTILMYT